MTAVPERDGGVAVDPLTLDPLTLERQVCFALAVASRRVISAYRPVLEPLQLTHPQYLVMLALWERAPLTLSELARMLDVEPATMSPLLKRLESLHYLTRQRNPVNERALEVTLTPAGRRLRARALAIPETMMERLELDRADVEELNTILTRLIGKTRTPPPA